jgi:general secretion pathway protein I
MQRRWMSAGFTLLEVMISLGILAVALMAIGDLNGGAVRMHAYAKKLTVAVQLARGKMLDVQEQLRKDGLSDYSKEYHGTFEDEGWPEFKWKAQVIKPDFDVDPTTAINRLGGGLGLDSAPGGIGGALSGLTGGGGLPGGASSGLSGIPSGPTGGAGGALGALGPMSGLVDAQVKQFSELIKNSVRELKLTVSWKAGSVEESFDVVEHIVVLPDAKNNAAANAQAKTGQGNTGPNNQLNNTTNAGNNNLNNLNTQGIH